MRGKKSIWRDRLQVGFSRAGGLMSKTSERSIFTAHRDGGGWNKGRKTCAGARVETRDCGGKDTRFKS